jgi:hypothetical protein
MPDPAPARVQPALAKVERVTPVEVEYIPPDPPARAPAQIQVITETLHLPVPPAIVDVADALAAELKDLLTEIDRMVEKSKLNTYSHPRPTLKAIKAYDSLLLYIKRRLREVFKCAEPAAASAAGGKP